MIRRKALLIACPGPPDDDYLSGVKVDIRNWRDFLKSPLGGAWAAGEISLLENPSAAAVKVAALSLAAVDYSMVVYTGHGHLDAASDRTYTAIGLDPGLPVSTLTKGADRHTVVVDSCRRPTARLPTMDALAKLVEKAEAQLSPEQCRRCFDQDVLACEPAHVTLYACSPGEFAHENERTGGYYTHHLLKATRDWFNENRGADTSDSYYSLSVVAAHRRASLALRRDRGDDQTPDSDKPKVRKFFPLAIIA